MPLEAWRFPHGIDGRRVRGAVASPPGDNASRRAGTRVASGKTLFSRAGDPVGRVVARRATTAPNRAGSHAVKQAGLSAD